MQWVSQSKRKNSKDRWLSFGCALFIHIVLLSVGGLLLMKPAEFGVDRGLSSVEVQLVAGVSQPVAVSQAVQKESLPRPVKNVEAVQTPVQEEIVQPVKSSTLGNSPVNAVSTGQGAETELKPSYLNNPAPRYPLKARQSGWEGTVLLKIFVDKNGHPEKVEIEKSSGHTVLDEAALKTLKTWQFRPARLGNMSMESSVRVPIRFNLDN